MERQEGAVLEGLWEPPGVTLEPRADAREVLARALAVHGIRAPLEPTGLVLRHRITHRAIEVEVWRALKPGPIATTETLKFVDLDKPRLALTAVARRAAEAIRG